MSLPSPLNRLLSAMHHWTQGLLAGATTAAIGIVLGLTPLGVGFEQSVGLSCLFKLRGPTPPPGDVVVVAIDDKTGSQLGLSKLPREWPRTVHGRVVDNLTRRGASAIVFDFDFQHPKQPEDDEAFRRAVANSGRVVLTQKLVGKRQPLVNASGKQTGSVWLEQLVPPIPALAAAAKGLGPFPLPKVEVAVHEFWAFKSSVGQAPTIPAIALQIHAMGAYPQLTRLLEKVGASAPQSPAADARAPEIRKFIRELRAAFENTPELGKTLKDILTPEASSEIPLAQRPLIQALVGLYDGGDNRYLNFYGPPGSITTIPYHVAAKDDAPDSEMELPDLTGKVAFVGFSDLYDPGQPDRFYTVFTNDDGVDLSGVEIAATAFGNLLTDRSLRLPGLLGEIAILGVFGAVIGAIVFVMPAVVGVPLVLTLTAGYGAGAYQAFAASDVWLPLAIPLLVQLPLALFAGLLGQYLSERRKKARANRAIGLYLPADLARAFTEKNLDPSALNRVTYSVCFASDMAGFTTIAESLRPKELASFLNDYFESLAEPLRRYGVDVMEFRADGIMCAWTAERPEVGIRCKALFAAIHAVDAITRFKERHALPSLSMRIGLEAGMVYVGHAGGGGHFVYSIVGDCANTAARIEGLNKHLGTQLLASLSALEGVDGLLTRFLGEFRFLGKSDPLPIVEILDMAKDAPETRTRLCERFAEAMAVLKNGDWSAASDAFGAILADYPNDGPSRYHWTRCQGHLNEAPPEAPWIIPMDSK